MRAVCRGLYVHAEVQSVFKGAKRPMFPITSGIGEECSLGGWLYAAASDPVVRSMTSAPSAHVRTT